MEIVITSIYNDCSIIRARGSVNGQLCDIEQSPESLQITIHRGNDKQRFVGRPVCPNGVALATTYKTMTPGGPRYFNRLASVSVGEHGSCNVTVLNVHGVGEDRSVVGLSDNRHVEVTMDDKHIVLASTDAGGRPLVTRKHRTGTTAVGLYYTLPDGTTTDNLPTGATI